MAATRDNGMCCPFLSPCIQPDDSAAHENSLKNLLTSVETCNLTTTCSTHLTLSDILSLIKSSFFILIRDTKLQITEHPIK